MKLITPTGTTIKVTHIGIDYGKIEVQPNLGGEVEEYEIPKRLAKFLRQVSQVK